MAPTSLRRLCATTPRASAASSSIRSYRRPTPSPANWQNARAGFDNLFQACAAETACNAAHPHLEETFTGLVNKLEAEPLTTTVSDPATGKDLKVYSTAGHWSTGCATRTMACPCSAPRRIGSMGSPPAAPRPSRRSPRIGQVGRRHPVRMSLPSATGWSYGVTCREDYPFATPEDLAAAGRQAFPDYPASIQREGVGSWAYVNEDCRDVWKVPAAPEAMRAARREQHPDAPHLRQLRYADVPRRGEGRGGEPVQRNHHQHSGHRAFCLPRVSLRPNGHRIVLRRSRRPRHILRRRIEAAYLHLKGLAVSRCATRLARLRANSRWMMATTGW